MRGAVLLNKSLQYYLEVLSLLSTSARNPTGMDVAVDHVKPTCSCPNLPGIGPQLLPKPISIRMSRINHHFGL